MQINLKNSLSQINKTLFNTSFKGNKIHTLKQDTFEKNTNGENVEKTHKYYVELSKDISYALRHKPEECNITLDEQGYTTIDELLNYLNSTKRHGKVDVSDLTKITTMFDKKRHEIKGDKIRAYYGHSTDDKIVKKEIAPPKILYHSTSHEAAEKIMQEGLTPQQRQYVHLSYDTKTAINVGRRKDKKPILLKIDAQRAHKDGYKFYEGNEKVMLADIIPPQYIEVMEQSK